MRTPRRGHEGPKAKKKGENRSVLAKNRFFLKPHRKKKIDRFLIFPGPKDFSRLVPNQRIHAPTNTIRTPNRQPIGDTTHPPTSWAEVLGAAAAASGAGGHPKQWARSPLGGCVYPSSEELGTSKPITFARRSRVHLRVSASG